MLHHLTIPACDPARVARVIAELWKTEAFPFIWPDSYVALADDGRGTSIEIVRRGDEQVPAPNEVGLRRNVDPSPYNEVHVLVCTRVDEAEMFAIARREGWIARACDRKFFRLVEFWLENQFLLELVTEEEAQRYGAFMSSGRWRDVLSRERMPLECFGYAAHWLEAPPKP